MWKSHDRHAAWAEFFTSSEDELMLKFFVMVLCFRILNLFELLMFRGSLKFVKEVMTKMAPVLSSMMVLALFIFTMGSGLFYLTERDYNGNFESLPDAAYMVFFYLTSGEWVDCDF